MLKTLIFLASIITTSNAETIDITGNEFGRIILLLIGFVILVSLLRFLYVKLMLSIGFIEIDKRKTTGIKYTPLGSFILTILGLLIIYFLATSEYSVNEMLEITHKSFLYILDKVNTFIFPNDL